MTWRAMLLKIFNLLFLFCFYKTRLPEAVNWDEPQKSRCKRFERFGESLTDTSNTTEAQDFEN